MMMLLLRDKNTLNSSSLVPRASDAASLCPFRGLLQIVLPYESSRDPLNFCRAFAWPLSIVIPDPLFVRRGLLRQYEQLRPSPFARLSCTLAIMPNKHVSRTVN